VLLCGSSGAGNGQTRSPSTGADAHAGHRLRVRHDQGDRALHFGVCVPAGGPNVPGWVRILLGGGIALLAGLHLNRSSGDRRVIGPPLGALGLAGVIALSF
jgi:hypothetical protein